MTRPSTLAPLAVPEGLVSRSGGPSRLDMQRRIGARTFDFSREVAVMGIINRTPDSFFDNGSTFELDRAVDAAIAAADDGADIVDVGGVPFGRVPPSAPMRSLIGWCHWSRRSTPLRMS